MYLGGEQSCKVAPRGAGTITHNLAWHITAGTQTGWLPLYPPQSLSGRPTPFPQLSWGAEV